VQRRVLKFIKSVGRRSCAVSHHERTQDKLRFILVIRSYIPNKDGFLDRKISLNICSHKINQRNFTITSFCFNTSTDVSLLSNSTHIVAYALHPHKFLLPFSFLVINVSLSTPILKSLLSFSSSFTLRRSIVFFFDSYSPPYRTPPISFFTFYLSCKMKSSSTSSFALLFAFYFFLSWRSVCCLLRFV